MTISADDFCEFADEIMEIGQQNKKEIYFRNVASRAYYCAYHQCVNLLIRKYGFQVPKEDSHQEVIRKLQQQDLDDLAGLLSRMKNLRKIADYELENIFTERDATQSLWYAQEVADRIKNVVNS